MEFLYLPTGVGVTLSDDDADELHMLGADAAEGVWHFKGNTDGGVLGALPYPASWSIDLVPGFSAGVTSWRYVDVDTPAEPLELGARATLTAFESPSACRTDCTIPRCGDAILDGGEVCDDGNAAPGDGCAADCKSYD
ncbi:MAG: DUF4215 domain-containing protein [Myxococcales bacterium]|nr:DUF4215 domain-containing protein [Myxococcales bacterium]